MKKLIDVSYLGRNILYIGCIKCSKYEGKMGFYMIYDKHPIEKIFICTDCFLKYMRCIYKCKILLEGNQGARIIKNTELLEN